MKSFLKTLTFIHIILLFSTGLAGANGNLDSLNLLTKVHSHLMENGHIVRLEFNKPVGEWADPIFYEKSVQIDFPGAFVEPSKRTFSAKSSLVSNVLASQYDGKTLRIRFHINPGTDDIEKRFKLVSQGRFMIARFDSTDLKTSVDPSKKIQNKNNNKKPETWDEDVLSEFLSRASEKIKNQEDNFPAEAEITANSYSSTVQDKEPVAEETEIQVIRAGMGPLVNPDKKTAMSDSAVEAKDASRKKLKPKTSTNKNASFSLKDSRSTGKPMELIPSGLKMLSMLAVVLGIMFLLFFGFKKYVLKNTAFGGGNKLVKVLGTGFLGPKKNIALVEVAGEILVLGMTQENITLLSSITDEEKIEEIKTAGGNGGSGLSWNPTGSAGKTDRTRSVASQAAGQFTNYLNKFSKPSGRDQTVLDVKEQILQKIGRMKTAKA